MHYIDQHERVLSIHPPILSSVFRVSLPLPRPALALLTSAQTPSHFHLFPRPCTHRLLHALPTIWRAPTLWQRRTGHMIAVSANSRRLLGLYECIRERTEGSEVWGIVTDLLRQRRGERRWQEGWLDALYAGMWIFMKMCMIVIVRGTKRSLGRSD
jgi:hypothetical protein